MADKNGEALIGAFSAEEPLILTPHQNGGWVVEQNHVGDPGRIPTPLGAYTNADDMLQALAGALRFEKALGQHDD